MTPALALPNLYLCVEASSTDLVEADGTMLKAFRRHFANRRLAATIRANADHLRDSRLWGAAAQLYKYYLEFRPHNAGIWVQLGHCQKESGLLDEANASYGRAAAIAPDTADIWLQIGHLRKLEGNLSEAAANYAKALIKDPVLMPARAELEQFGYELSDIAQLIAEQGSQAAMKQFDKLNERISTKPGAIKERLLELNSKVEEFASRLAGQEERIDEVCARLDEVEESINTQPRYIDRPLELMSTIKEISDTSQLRPENVDALCEYEAIESRIRAEPSFEKEDKAEMEIAHNGFYENQNDNYKDIAPCFLGPRTEEIYQKLRFAVVGNILIRNT
jgi:tetratricopeptide (TPR) repeat protein